MSFESTASLNDLFQLATVTAQVDYSTAPPELLP